MMQQKSHDAKCTVAGRTQQSTVMDGWWALFEKGYGIGWM
jgi:hypothetical protein